MALPWLIGAAVVAAGAAIVKAVNDNEEEERREREREREREIEREYERKREEARRANAREEETRLKKQAVISSVSILTKEYNLECNVEKISEKLLSISDRGNGKQELLAAWDMAQNRDNIEQLQTEIDELNNLKTQLSRG